MIILIAERESARIARDILSEPHIRDRRFRCRQVYPLVGGGTGEEPEAVADRFDLDVADVYHALAYYHDHLSEMRVVEEARTATFESVHESVDRLKVSIRPPPVTSE